MGCLGAFAMKLFPVPVFTVDPLVTLSVFTSNIVCVLMESHVYVHATGLHSQLLYIKTDEFDSFPFRTHHVENYYLVMYH